jgi:iron complex outermembrane recepter protein
MNQNLQSVTVNDYQGNPFQADVQFRGFTASPQIGTPQGLSVFVDGVRVNEPFGDVVNWDLIPLNAIKSFDVYPGSNPLFGLNTLGGALSVRTKDGFENEELIASVLAGSWGRIQGQVSGGGHLGPLGAYISVTDFHESGWRDNSPTDVQQGFGKLSLRAGRVEMDISVLLAGNDLIGNGLLPTEIYEQRAETIFTSPDQTKNSLSQFTVGGQFEITPKINFTAQVYRRNSNRRAGGGDIYEEFENFSGRFDGPQNARFPEDVIPGFEVCKFQDINQDGVPDYYLDARSFDFDGDGVLEPDGFYDPIDDGPLNPTGLSSLEITSGGERGALEFLEALNSFNCDVVQYSPQTYPVPPDSPVLDVIVRDGASGTLQGRAGLIEGTPIGVISETNIGQTSDGGSMQFNFNLERHALLLGASVDRAMADYFGQQRLALIDATHKVYLAPADIDPLFLAGRQPIVNNQFDGVSVTSSAYFSETWSPRADLHFSLAARYNHTRVKNNLTSRANADQGDLHEFRDFDTARPDSILCPSADIASCPSELNNSSFSDLRQIIDNPNNLDERSRTRLVPTRETYNYQSFNPAIGVSFLPTPGLQSFLNWSQGTRAPSVVELGCAFDPTLIDVDSDGVVDVPQGIARPNACTLPTTLSGDPFLPQIFARSMELGFKGQLPNQWEWNLSAYRIDLSDDLYFVGGSRGQGNFQSIGDTRRRGLELGFGGPINRFLSVHFNYGLTAATFQTPLFILSPRNSSRLLEGEGGGENQNYQPTSFDPVTGRALVQLEDMIAVEPGDRLPGVPLHNVNATLSVQATERWSIDLNMVAHSSIYVRGDETNEHAATTLNYVDLDTGIAAGIPRTEVYRFDGKLAGFAIFNLRTRVDLAHGLSVFGQVNNLLNTEYFSAGRLGINPFSPSTVGAIGPSGWNYNSTEWLPSTFVAPGAPRAIWVGLEYQY